MVVWDSSWDLLISIVRMVWWCERKGCLECSGERRDVVELSLQEGRDLLEGLLLGFLGREGYGILAVGKGGERRVWVNGCCGSSHYSAVTGEVLPDTRPLRLVGPSKHLSPNICVREVGRAPCL